MVVFLGEATPVVKKKPRTTSFDLSADTGAPLKEKKPKSSFLDLSAELRNHVYSLALVRDNVFYLDGFQFMGPFAPPDISVNLLATSRQIYQEAAPILYGANKFQLCFEDQLALIWLHHIGGNIIHLRSVNVILDLAEMEKETSSSFRKGLKACLNKLNRAPKLRVLELELCNVTTPLDLENVPRVQVLRRETFDRQTQFLAQEMGELFLPLPYTTYDEVRCMGYDHDVPLVSAGQGPGSMKMYSRSFRSSGRHGQLEDNSETLSDEDDVEWIERPLPNLFDCHGELDCQICWQALTGLESKAGGSLSAP